METTQKISSLWDFLNTKGYTPENIKKITAKDIDPTHVSENTKPIFKVDIEKLGGITHVKLNYDQINCPKTLEMTHQARGIVLEYDPKTRPTKPYMVVCYPFNRFFNWSEETASPIDWKSAKVLEKVDGSIIMAWWCEPTKQWIFSTRGKISPVKPFLGEIKRILSNKKVPVRKFMKIHTYIFELYTGETQVKISYREDRFVHIGTRSMIAPYQEIDHTICPTIEKPKLYNFSDYKLVCEDNTPGVEGYVIVDGRWKRQKVKTKLYLSMITTEFTSDYYLFLSYLSGELTNSLGDNPGSRLKRKHNQMKLVATKWTNTHMDIISSTKGKSKMDVLRDRTFPSYLKGHLNKGFPKDNSELETLLKNIIVKFTKKHILKIIEEYTQPIVETDISTNKLSTSTSS